MNWLGLVNGAVGAIISGIISYCFKFIENKKLKKMKTLRLKSLVMADKLQREILTNNLNLLVAPLFLNNLIPKSPFS